MTNYESLEATFTKHLGLSRRPVAVTTCEQPPAGVAKFQGSVPSGCTFWQLAAQGRAFYTETADHYNCAVGCYTHRIALPPEREAELGSTVKFMSEIGYIKMEDVPGIAQLPTTPRYIVYAPLGEAPVAPAVVIFAGKAGKIMLLQEAALRAGVKTQPGLLARPTCMAIPAAMTGGTTASTGCVGNRVYTGLDEGELYVMAPGGDVEKIAGELDTIAAANEQLNTYHRARKEELLRVG